jgi:transposase
VTFNLTLAISTVVTTNRSFSEWHEVFPNAACVVSLVDRLVHRAEVIAIEGESYRVKEAREIYLIVDGHPVHRSRAVRRFVADHAQRLRLIQLPGYCPELNPDELLNQDVKTNVLGKNRPTSKAQMIDGVRRHLRRRQKEPHVIRNLFKEKHVRYAA